MRVDKFSKNVEFRGEDGESLRVTYDNRGEPYREGITLHLEAGSKYQSVFLEAREARELRVLLNQLYGV